MTVVVIQLQTLQTHSFSLHSLNGSSSTFAITSFIPAITTLNQPQITHASDSSVAARFPCFATPQTSSSPPPSSIISSQNTHLFRQRRHARRVRHERVIFAGKQVHQSFRLTHLPSRGNRLPHRQHHFHYSQRNSHRLRWSIFPAIFAIKLSISPNMSFKNVSFPRGVSPGVSSSCRCVFCSVLSNLLAVDCCNDKLAE